MTVALCGVLLGAAEFEVASIRPSAAMAPGPNTKGGAGREGGPAPGGNACGIPKFTMDAGRVDFACAALTRLISFAFGIPQERVAGPDWMGDAKFDVVAKLPPGASENQVPEMFQALLADRFKLAVHRGSKETPLFALVVDKGGLKLKEAGNDLPAPPVTDPNAPPCPLQNFNCAPNIQNLDGVQTRMIPLSPNTRRISSPRIGTALFTQGLGERGQHLEAPGTTLEGLADLVTLLGSVGQPVVDRTGLNGRYRVDLEIPAVSVFDIVDHARTSGSDPNAELAAAMQNAWQAALQKVGLHLDPRKGPVETLVVDHLDKTPTPN